MRVTYADTIKWIKQVMDAAGCTEDVAIAAMLETCNLKDAIEWAKENK